MREEIGLTGQYAAVDEYLTGRENLRLQARFYHIPRSESEDRVNLIIKTVGLEEASDRRAGTYSGGMRRRLDLALSLIHSPGVLFLDEFPEFGQTALESLREPLESGAVTISRVRGSATFPRASCWWRR